MAKNVITRGKPFNQSGFLDAEIEAETKRKIELIDGAEDFGIRTACIIDNEFILISDYDLSFEMLQEIKKV